MEYNEAINQMEAQHNEWELQHKALVSDYENCTGNQFEDETRRKNKAFEIFSSNQDRRRLKFFKKVWIKKIRTLQHALDMADTPENKTHIQGQINIEVKKHGSLQIKQVEKKCVKHGLCGHTEIEVQSSMQDLIPSISCDKCCEDAAHFGKINFAADMEKEFKMRAEAKKGQDRIDFEAEQDEFKKQKKGY